MVKNRGHLPWSSKGAAAVAEYSSKREERKDEITQREDILVGRNAVSEALRSGRTIDKV